MCLEGRSEREENCLKVRLSPSLLSFSVSLLSVSPSSLSLSLSLVLFFFSLSVSLFLSVSPRQSWVTPFLKVSVRSVSLPVSLRWNFSPKLCFTVIAVDFFLVLGADVNFRFCLDQLPYDPTLSNCLCSEFRLC